MTDDPAIRQRGRDIEIILFDASAVVVKGVVALAETSAGEAGAPFGEFGPLAWIAFDGDPSQIEFVQYRDPATRRRTHRRVVKAERIGSQWNAVKLHLAIEAVDLGTQGDWDANDYAPADFAAG